MMVGGLGILELISADRACWTAHRQGDGLSSQPACSKAAHRSSADRAFGQSWALSQWVPAPSYLLLVCWDVLVNFLGRKSRSS